MDLPGDGVELESELPDLLGLPVLEVLEVDSPALADALQRLRVEAEQPGEVLSGWSSAI
jgi:FXSXX-COOH protein